MARDGMTEHQMEANIAFWKYLQMKKKAKAEGRKITEDRQTIRAQEHMKHKPYGKL